MAVIEPRYLASKARDLLWVSELKTTECCFYEAKYTKQGAVGVSASSDARRLCDGVFSPTGRADSKLQILFHHFIIK